MDRRGSADARMMTHWSGVKRPANPGSNPGGPTILLGSKPLYLEPKTLSSMASQRAKYKFLLEDPDIQRWYRNLARGSQITADICLRRLGGFCAERGITPKDLAAMEQKKLEDLLLDAVGELEAQGKAGSYIKSILKALKSWLHHNRREIKVKIKIKGADETPTLRDERVPTKNELLRILLAGDKKTRAASALVAFAGLRLETLGNYHGNDGLRVGDFPEMRVEDGRVVFERIPTLVVVRESLSKARHRYFTFLGEEGCRYLKEYLEERMKQGERITDSSPVITPKLRKKPFIRTINIGDMIRAAIRKAGFPWRPYVLRSYFDTQLMVAENAGKVIRDYRQFWMGHKGDIEARYTTNKHRLPENVVEDMRASYQRCQEYLQTTVPEAPSGDKIREEFKRHLLLVAGFEPAEVEKINLSAMRDDEFQEMIRQKLLTLMENNGARQKIVPIEEIEKYIARGWEFVAALPNGKAVIRLPT